MVPRVSRLLLPLFAYSACLLATINGHANETNKDDLLFIDNGTIKVGVKRNWGAGIAWISPSGSDENYINHHDHGRLVQQSYYGNKDDSDWNKQPWRWNPVQGGDWKGNAAKVLELKHGKDWLESTTLPKHWASGQDIHEVRMYQHIKLDGPLVRMRFKMTYAGKVEHIPHHQEIPAMFIPAKLHTLVIYDGKEPWTGKPVTTSKPGWPNEYRTPTEKWAAYVGDDGKGIGIWTPVLELITCYRFGSDENTPSSCSYVAPLITFAIAPGFSFEYDCAITMGSTEEMRGRFQKLAKESAASASGDSPTLKAP